VRQIDQAIAERHHLGLRYPHRLLAQAVVRVLAGEAIESAAKAIWKGAGGDDVLPKDDAAAIETKFITDLRGRPALLPGVEAGLKRLHASGALILVLTEGNRGRVLRTASEYGLVASFDRVIELPKVARLYERVLRLTGRPKQSFMVGDQLQRDIAPAKAAGLTTIYIPGRFRPRWEPDEDAVGPSYRVERFDQAAEIIL
jgi:putative hydrolase of the HAD superfamily